MFGFQLSNIIPGFPRHTLYFVDPPYELLASQESENGQVSHYINPIVNLERNYFCISKGSRSVNIVLCDLTCIYQGLKYSSCS